jgi:hypothetical protein
MLRGVVRLSKFLLRLLVSAALYALGFALVLGLFGAVASVLDHKPDLWWQVAGVGGYFGALVGIGQGIKTTFGYLEREPGGKEVAKDMGKSVAGGLVPGLNAVLFLGDLLVWMRGARMGPYPGRNAALEALAWSILAAGAVVLVYFILRLDMGSFAVGYALLFIPAAALVGAIRGAYSSPE